MNVEEEKAMFAFDSEIKCCAESSSSWMMTLIFMQLI